MQATVFKVKIRNEFCKTYVVFSVHVLKKSESEIVSILTDFQTKKDPKPYESIILLCIIKASQIAGHKI